MNCKCVYGQDHKCIHCGAEQPIGPEYSNMIHLLFTRVVVTQRGTSDLVQIRTTDASSSLPPIWINFETPPGKGIRHCLDYFDYCPDAVFDVEGENYRWTSLWRF